MAGKCKIEGDWRNIIKFFKKTNDQWGEITESSDAVYTTDKKLSLHINGVEHFSNFAVDDTTFQNLTIEVGVGMTNFTIKEFKVERTNE